MVKRDRLTLIFLIVPPLLAGLVLGANQTRAGAYLPWLLSIGYWMAISLATWLALALGTMITRLLLRPWSPPDGLNWLVGAVVGSLAARPVIYAIASQFRPLMEAPTLRQMPPASLSPDFLVYYVTNWSVIIVMWLTACWLEAKLRRDAASRHHAAAPVLATRESRLSDRWDEDGFLSRIPRALGRDVLALQSEDHYVRLFTRDGDALILASISEAVRALESGGCAGQRVHRSWWIAIGAIGKSEVRGRRMFVTLVNGVEVPVSQTYREVARIAGLVPSAAHAS